MPSRVHSNPLTHTDAHRRVKNNSTGGGRGNWVSGTARPKGEEAGMQRSLGVLFTAFFLSLHSTH